MHITTIFLDAGGVLVHVNWERVSATLGRHGVRIDSEQLRAAEPHVKKEIDTKSIIRSSTDRDRFISYLGATLRTAGVVTDSNVERAFDELAKYHNEHNLFEYVPEDVLPALAALRQRGFRLVIVSNANGTLKQCLRRLQLWDAVDYVLDSHEEGVEKPDPAFFRLALERSGSKAESTLHIGDLYHVDVVGARCAGVHAVLLDSAGLYAEYDCARLRSFGELPEFLAGRRERGHTPKAKPVPSF